MKFPIYLKMMGSTLNVNDIFMVYPYVQFAANVLDTYQAGKLLSWVAPEELVNKRYTAYGNAKEILENDFGISYRTRSKLLRAMDEADTEEERNSKIQDISDKLMGAYKRVMSQIADPVGKRVIELVELLYTLEEAQQGMHVKANLTSAPVYTDKDTLHPFNNNLLGAVLKSKFVVGLVPTSKQGEDVIQKAHERFLDSTVSADHYQDIFTEVEEGVPVSIIQVIFGIYTGNELLSRLI